MAMNVTPFVGTDNFNMETFNNMISQINSGVDNEISDVLAQLGTKAKIQTGSYVGTGTYGASNPCSLTFDFTPKFVMVYINGINIGVNTTGGRTGWLNGSFIFSPEMTKQLSNCAYLNRKTLFAYVYFNLVGNTLYFYGETVGDGSSSLSSSINENGITYHYIAIG